jgi:hypothetical protein
MLSPSALMDPGPALFVRFQSVARIAAAGRPVASGDRERAITMTNSSSPSPASRPRAARGVRSTVDTRPAPELVAYAASSLVTTESGDAIHVEALCWPLVPNAWTALAKTWEAVRAGRGTRVELPGSNGPAVPWIRVCAPQLAAPFRDTAAEESSVAGLLSRTPVQMAIAIHDSREHLTSPSIAPDVATRQTLAECLAIYDRFARSPGRQPCNVLVARGHDASRNQQYQDSFQRSRRRLGDVDWINRMQLRFCAEAVLPLPLELAQAAAESVAQQQCNKGVHHPIFDMVLTKLIQTPPALQRPGKAKRR